MYYLCKQHWLCKAWAEGGMTPDTRPKTFGDLIMTKNKTSITLVTTLLATIASAPAMAVDVASVFSKGRTHLAVVVGNGYAFDESYTVIGAGVSYYLADGLNIGLNVESWSGGDPSIYKVTPSVQYVFYQVPRVSPYLGAFYRRSYIEDLEDLNSAGGRAGVYIAAGRNAFIGVGAVYESYLDCNTTTYIECSNTYPELSFTFAF